ncbi:NAD(P)/FAD-dependent oxidoreductase [Streptomyces mobaraensis]|uniref:NAD(P)/FAD-dependent oxidoreductase n=1 Tax=Streptomyces mobaraensis TaxID=35621 RepID=UPI0013E00F07|nr:FAD-dependent monooxygenase [Streptomyces mobaraensis]
MTLFAPEPSAAHEGVPWYDVVVCGGGLAGATFSRHLRRERPDASVLVVDGQTYPVPPAAHKVGESTVDIAGFYFASVLGLAEYMAEKHLPKLGLRYFFGRAGEPFADAPEIGLSAFCGRPTYQIDRGVLENDLYTMNRRAGVEIATGAKVLDIDLAPGRDPHLVRYTDGDGVARTARCRWVVDAMGRARFLQRKLGLGRPTEGEFNAAWFRVTGRLDVEDFVPDDQVDWHKRVPGRRRRLSTVHLMGPGYWVWLIPLGSGNTSVGIVSSGEFHDIDGMSTLPDAVAWLERHEPAVASALVRHEVLDFLAVRDYSYTTSRVFSADRWGCVGEAAAFSDPFYSPGSNMIAFENSALIKLIGDDARQALRPERVEELNRFVLGQNDWVEYNIHSSYSYFGEPLIMALSFIWDTLVGWTTATPQMFNGIFLDEEKAAAVRAATPGLYALTLQVKRLFKQWERKDGRQGRNFRFIDYYTVPFLREAYERNLVEGKSADELAADHRHSMAVLEEVALAVFLIAVEDTMPERRARLHGHSWLNAWAIGLDPERWEADGLFEPTTPPRSFDRAYADLTELFDAAPPETGATPVTLPIQLRL